MAVSKFTEKPNVERAKELLAMGALWNGGVFAFRLGYMMEIAQRYVKADSFEEMRSRYSEFPKISFDYEVAEKAESVRLCGQKIQRLSTVFIRHLLYNADCRICAVLP